MNSSVLDNIAGALIGGAMAHQLFRAKVHIGYLAAIVAACLVLAGPGVGKTTVLTTRIARILDTSRNRNFRILALTFTTKAGDEMRTRVEELGQEVSSHREAAYRLQGRIRSGEAASRAA